MSKIKVDTIESRSGNTLTFGATGDTITLGGSSFNGTSSVIWDTTAKTSAFNAVAGSGYFVDTTSAAITATLPSTPSAGDIIAFKDYAGTFGTNSLTIARNGENIQGETKNATIFTNRASLVLVYVDATEGWLFTVESNVGELTKLPPDAPTIGVATATGATTATVSFTAPADDGGSPITLYTATSSPDGITGTLAQAGSGTITVSGLTTDTAYTFTVTATNAVGTSDPSAASNSVTPENPAFVAATGGTTTTSGDFKIHTFTSSGTFTVSEVGNPLGSDSVEYLVIAGGGGGGRSDRGGGGGGAGGYRTASGFSVSVQGYPITVGGGGSAASSSQDNGSSGSSSIFSSITSSGGGGGGGNANGASGGSGGGASHNPGSAGGGNVPSVSPPQGNPGGAGQDNPEFNGGGGGGASASGVPGSLASTGGDGSPSTITGSNVTRAGGGGGGRQPGVTSPAGPAGAGGAGGGGGPSYGDAGDVNTGSGGVGGTGSNAGNEPAGAGGSGVVIIRYKFQ